MQLRRFHYLFFLSILLLLLASCKKEKEEFDFGYDFYPMEVGTYRIYDIVRKEYVSTIPESDTFQVKEMATETFTIGGEPRYRLERYYRDSENDPWPIVPDSIWSVHVSTQRVVRVENNIRYVNLVFPVEKNMSWNGNIENFKGADTYTIKSAGGPYELSGKNYDKTAYILQEFDTNQVDVDIRFDVYSKGIGLVERYKETYAYFQKPDGTLTDTIESGVIYHEILNSYGN